MKAIWDELSSAARAVCGGPEAANRVSNLSIFAALAVDLRLIPKIKRPAWSAEVLRLCIEKIALSPLPRFKKSGRAWERVAHLAREAALCVEQPGGPDQWVACLQDGDIARKAKGAYATPSALAEGLVRLTLAPLVGKPAPLIIDPSSGTGALLSAVLDFLGRDVGDAELRSIVYGLHGVELDPIAREFCCLMLWTKAARAKANLKRIANNIVIDNAITRPWWSLRAARFDALVMNPPWESLRHELPGLRSQAKIRAKTIARLSKEEDVTEGLPALFSAQGRGDKNLFKAFVELAPHLLKDGGRIGALIPAAFASDLGMAPLRSIYLNHFSLESWTSFENLRRHFPIDGRYKFGVLIGARSSLGTESIAVRAFATEPFDLFSKHVRVTAPMITTLGGESRMIPEVRDEEEANLLTHILSVGTPLFERGSLGLVRYRREVDLSLDKGTKFRPFNRAGAMRTLRDGTYRIGSMSFAPLVEGRMVGRYDIFQKSWKGGKGRTAQWELNSGSEFETCEPQFIAETVSRDDYRVAICDVTSATNTRTVHAALVPKGWSCGNTAPVLAFETEEDQLAGLAILNSLVFDWTARRIVGGLHLNKFYLATLVWPTIDKSTVRRLGELARDMLACHLRNPESATCNVVPEKVEAEIEREVAQAFELSEPEFRKLLSDDRSDRRGFWRYFDANPDVQRALDRVIGDYGSRAIVAVA